MYTKKTTVWVATESTPGTAVTPAAGSNAVMAFNVDLSVTADMKERGPGNSDRSEYANIRGKTSVDLKFGIELKGSGTAGTAPKYMPLLQACDRAVTSVGSTSVTFTPAATSQTCTIWVNIDGIMHKLAGCAGDCEIDLTAGEVPMLNFTIKGIYVLATDIAVVSPTYDSTIPPIVKGTTTTFGAYAAILEKIQLMFGNEVVERTDFNQAEAILSFIIGNRKPSGTMTCEAVLRATSNADFWSYFGAGTTKALSMVLGATAGNIITITAPVCTLGAPKYADRGGLRTMDIDFQCARSSGDDEITIVLT